MADETTTAPVAQPVTSQDVTPPATSQDPIDAQHSSDNFKALNELFDKVEVPVTSPVTPTVPTPTPTTAPTPTPVAPDDAFEKSLEVPINERAHPNVLKAADELRRISREEHKARVEAELKLQEYDTKVKEYEQKLQKPEVPEDIKKELDDLKAFRREVDLRLDPDFQKTYVTPVQEAEANILSILQEAGLKDEHLKYIQDNGGIIALSKSTEILELPNGKEVSAQQWVNDELLGRTPIFHRNRALGELTNALNLQDKAAKELQSFRSQGEERYKAKIEKFRTEFDAGRDAAIAELGEEAQPKAVTATMTAEERLSAEAHNTRLREAAARFEEYIKTSQDPKVSGRIVVKATQADVLFAANQELKATNAQLRQELDSIKAAGDHSHAGDSTPPPGPTQITPKDLLKTPDSKALSDLLTGAGVLR